jgi:TRAP-type C4-dicarboxylate transport system permease small subunit
MVKYLLLCLVFVIGLNWAEPHLRSMAGVTWLPTGDSPVWFYTAAALLAGAVLTGIIFVVKLALHLWREIGD